MAQIVLTSAKPKSGPTGYDQPPVAAASEDWAAAVERITRERSLPNPRLTFETDLTRIVESLITPNG